MVVQDYFHFRWVCILYSETGHLPYHGRPMVSRYLIHRLRRLHRFFCLCVSARRQAWVIGLNSPKLASFRLWKSDTRYPVACCGVVHYVLKGVDGNNETVHLLKEETYWSEHVAPGRALGHFRHFDIAYRVVPDEIFQLRYLVVRQLPKLHTSSPHCDGTQRDFVGFDIRNGFKGYLAQMKTIVGQKYA